MTGVVEVAVSIPTFPDAGLACGHEQLVPVELFPPQ